MHKGKVMLRGSGVVVLLIIALHARAATGSAVHAPLSGNTYHTKEIALTFDDGPYGTSTAEVLDILEKEQIHATFFLIGKNVEEYPVLAKREVTDGDVIGNHSYDHSMLLPAMNAPAFELNLLQAQLAIASTTGVFPTLYRPPYGALSPTMKKVLHKDRFHIDLWNLDTEDWNYQKSPTKEIEKEVLDEVKPGSVILFHDGRDTQVNYPRDNMINALPLIIDDLKNEGYTFVTIDKMK